MPNTARRKSESPYTPFAQLAAQSFAQASASASSKWKTHEGDATFV
jgi:hypothetical protein